MNMALAATAEAVAHQHHSNKLEAVTNEALIAFTRVQDGPARGVAKCQPCTQHVSDQQSLVEPDQHS
jgi:hypothetical protein